jgi:hypothetical protein
LRSLEYLWDIRRNDIPVAAVGGTIEVLGEQGIIWIAAVSSDTIGLFLLFILYASIQVPFCSTRPLDDPHQGLVCASVSSVTVLRAYWILVLEGSC